MTDQSTAIDAKRKNVICTEGVHTFKIAKSAEKQGPKGPYWNFQYVCTDAGPDQGTAVWDIVSLAEAARFRVDQFLDAVGAPEEGTVRHENFVGRTVRIKVKWDTYEGTVKAVVDGYMPATAKGASAPATPNGSPVLPKDAGDGSFKPPF